MTVSDIAKIKFARIISVEVERFFSLYKSMLQSNHRTFNFDNLSNMFIVYGISLLSISRRKGSIYSLNSFVIFYNFQYFHFFLSHILL